MTHTGITDEGDEAKIAYGKKTDLGKALSVGCSHTEVVSLSTLQRDAFLSVFGRH